MYIRYGFDIVLDLPQETTFVTALDVHPSRRSDIVEEQGLGEGAFHAVRAYVDAFGNICRTYVAPAGSVHLTARGTLIDSGLPDPIVENAEVGPLAGLPPDVAMYLLGSRYCETDLLSSFAWSRFGHIQGSAERVRAVIDFVHNHLTFGYQHSRPTRTAAEALQEGVGVCRDFTHLAVALCRCLNIPARYCNGYLGDIGVPPDPAPMDFNAWLEVFLDGRWWTVDARHNQPRIGRILIAAGRDATDVAMISSFGPHLLSRFEVVTHEVGNDEMVLAA